MDDISTLNHLESLAYRLGIDIRYECLEGEQSFFSGGLCRIRGKKIIFIDSRASKKTQIQAMTTALRRFDLDQVYLKPALRELLEMPKEIEI